MKKGFQVCWECGKSMERCKPAVRHVDGTIEWVCRRCWQELEYDRYLYEHRK